MHIIACLVAASVGCDTHKPEAALSLVGFASPASLLRHPATCTGGPRLVWVPRHVRKTERNERKKDLQKAVLDKAEASVGQSLQDLRQKGEYRPQEAVLDKAEASVGQSLQDLRQQTGWRDGDRFLFGYGALLAHDVWRRRGIDESLGGKRQALRVVAPSRGLRFSVKGGWASVDPLPFDSGVTQEVHGIIVPVSDSELALHAAKEGGYALGLSYFLANIVACFMPLNRSSSWLVRALCAMQKPY